MSSHIRPRLSVIAISDAGSAGYGLRVSSERRERAAKQDLKVRIKQTHSLFLFVVQKKLEQKIKPPAVSIEFRIKEAVKMRHTKVTLAVILIILFFSTASASAKNPGGVWVKTNHQDPQNITLFYVDRHSVKAIGYGRITGKPAIWHAEGSFRRGQLTLTYRYSPYAKPDGWEAEGTMELTVSEDGTRMNGSARSRSGAWAGPVEFRRTDLGPN